MNQRLLWHRGRVTRVRKYLGSRYRPTFKIHTLAPFMSTSACPVHACNLNMYPCCYSWSPLHHRAFPPGLDIRLSSANFGLLYTVASADSKGIPRIYRSSSLSSLRQSLAPSCIKRLASKAKQPQTKANSVSGQSGRYLTRRMRHTPDIDQAPCVNVDDDRPFFGR